MDTLTYSAMYECSKYCFVEQAGLGGPTNCMVEKAVPQLISRVSWLTNECNTPPNDAFSPVRWGVGTRPGHRFVPMAKKSILIDFSYHLF